MPYASGTIKVQILGTNPGSKQWATGFQCRQNNSASLSNATIAVANTVAAALIAMGVGQKALFTSAQTITEVLAYGYDGGKDAATVASSPVGVTGNSTNVQLPNQVALICSLRTANLSRAGRGRMYWSCLGAQNASGQATSQAVTNLNGLVTSIFTNLKGSTSGSTGLPCVPTVASLAKGTMNDITSIIVDSRFDTQRDRAEGVPASATNTVQSSAWS